MIHLSNKLRFCIAMKAFTFVSRIFWWTFLLLSGFWKIHFALKSKLLYVIIRTSTTIREFFECLCKFISILRFWMLKLHLSSLQAILKFNFMRPKLSVVSIQIWVVISVITYCRSNIHIEYYSLWWTKILRKLKFKTGATRILISHSNALLRASSTWTIRDSFSNVFWTENTFKVVCKTLGNSPCKSLFTEPPYQVTFKLKWKHSKRTFCIFYYSEFHFAFKIWTLWVYCEVSVNNS